MESEEELLFSAGAAGAAGAGASAKIALTSTFSAGIVNVTGFVAASVKPVVGATTSHELKTLPAGTTAVKVTLAFAAVLFGCTVLF